MSAPYDWPVEPEFALSPHRPAVTGDAEAAGGCSSLLPAAVGEFVDSDPTPAYGIQRGLWIVKP